MMIRRLRQAAAEEENIMLTIYGSQLCPDCREYKANLDAHGVSYTYIDINKNMKNLKAFLKLRDSLPVFAPAKEAGAVGIPAILREDGAVTLDWEGWMQEQGLPIVYRERAQACGVDGQGC